MQIPSVSGMFQARIGQIGGRLPSLGMADFAGSFANAYAGAVGASSGQADYNLQQLTILPSEGDAQIGAAQVDTVDNTLASLSDASGTPPLYIPAETPATPTPPAESPAVSPEASSLAQKIISFAEQYIGTPYVWGGEDLDKGVDCSGLTQSVFAQFGVKLPRTAYRQSMTGTEVDPDNMQPGDLMFFKYCDRAPVTHVAMYIGDGKIIEAVHKGVAIRSLRGNWKKSLVVVKREIQD